MASASGGASHYHQGLNACRSLPEMDTSDTVSNDGRRLDLRGFYVDRIALAAETPPGGILEDADELGGYTAEVPVARWRRYMAADALELLAQREGSDRHKSMSKLLYLNPEIEDAINGTMISEEKKDPRIAGLSLRDTWRNSWFLCGKRDLFITKCGGFGFAPCSMKPGDESQIHKKDI
ncbi:hypothetical protein LZ32DRAFT_663674 [Colletotrichum eremochloae]|nr:hypothetical protein LZ32DRAFT_663674 [Colletotrichum eremochloae]